MYNLWVDARLRVADDAAKLPFYSEGGRFSAGRMGYEGPATESEAQKSARLAELASVMEESKQARRRLGQRTGASELGRGGIEDALYGDGARKAGRFRDKLYAR